MPLYKGYARATAADGKFRQVILLGLDDATLDAADSIPFTPSAGRQPRVPTYVHPRGDLSDISLADFEGKAPSGRS